MANTSRSRTPEEIALLEAAARTLPGGVLGSARFPDDVPGAYRAPTTVQPAPPAPPSPRPTWS